MPTPVNREPVRSAQQKTFTLEDVGSITLHRPSFKDMVTIGRKVTEYSEGAVITDIDANALIRVRAAIETLAEDDLGFNFDDPNLPYECFFDFYGKYIEWINSFRHGGASKSTDDTRPASAE